MEQNKPDGEKRGEVEHEPDGEKRREVEHEPDSEKRREVEKGATKRTWRTVLREKTWWDWLQILIVPLAIALVAFMLDGVSAILQAANEAQQQQQALVISSRQQRQLEERRAQAASFQAYLDEMSQLLLEHDLRDSQEGSNVRALAQARTTSVMKGRLDSDREGILLQFLYEAKLIDKRNPIVVLAGVDASDADLSRTVLGAADLKGVDLSGADLSGSELVEADLSCSPPVYWWMKSKQSCTDLTGANLSGTNLHQSNLSCAPAVQWWMETERTDCVDLRNANLSGADLTFADLSGANLTDADVTQEQLDKAILLGARMPNGQQYEEWVADRVGGGEEVTKRVAREGCGDDSAVANAPSDFRKQALNDCVKSILD